MMTQEDIEQEELMRKMLKADKADENKPKRTEIRNRPCPCGSGKRFKNCCLHTLPRKNTRGNK